MANYQDFPERLMDEAWEMNVHVNPLDDDTIEALKRHQAILKNFSDDFVTLIHQTEKNRLEAVKQQVYEDKLADFAIEDDK